MYKVIAFNTKPTKHSTNVPFTFKVAAKLVNYSVNPSMELIMNLLRSCSSAKQAKKFIRIVMHKKIKIDNILLNNMLDCFSKYPEIETPISIFILKFFEKGQITIDKSLLNRWINLISDFNLLEKVYNFMIQNKDSFKDQTIFSKLFELCNTSEHIAYYRDQMKKLEIDPNDEVKQSKINNYTIYYIPFSEIDSMKTIGSFNIHLAPSVHLNCLIQFCMKYGDLYFYGSNAGFPHARKPRYDSDLDLLVIPKIPIYDVNIFKNDFELILDELAFEVEVNRSFINYKITINEYVPVIDIHFFCLPSNQYFIEKLGYGLVDSCLGLFQQNLFILGE